ncbi:MAG TPA: VWA domain-containing protein, partial [Thermoanaerobaculia bacterium]|nr:VWA domain-containing protein [Thermoanaerobaculia bacterium]
AETGVGPAGVRRFRVAVTAPGGVVVRSVALSLDDEAVARWTEPPFVAEIPAARLASAVLLRAVAVDGDGRESSAETVPRDGARVAASEEVRLVELSVSVLDAGGRFVTGLGRGDFAVREDGVPQEVVSFETARTLPLSFGLALDRSASMRDAMPLAREAATLFVEGLLQGPDRAFVLAFDAHPELLVRWTGSPSEAAAALGRVAPGGGTALHDAIVLAFHQLRGVPGRKAVIVVTDGVDEHSRVAYGPARRFVESAGAPLFLIGLGTAGASLPRRDPDEVRAWRALREMALASGGDAVSIESERDLGRAFAAIETELRSQYVVRYVSSSRKGEDAFRSIEVKLADPTLRARTIRGYFP